jgi:endonuclease IV
MIGIHVSKVSQTLVPPNRNRKTLLEAIKIECEKLNLKACQIFIQGPQNTKMANINEKKIKDYCSEKKINLYVHSSYLTVGCWNITKKNADEAKSKYSIDSIIKQMEVCDKLNSKGFVVHLSKKTPKQIIETLKVLYPLIKKFNTPFLLEQPAKKPDDILTYETPQKLNTLTNLIIKNLPKFNFGWCLDTCHLWSGGIELDLTHVTKQYFDEIKNPEYIKLFHINGGSVDIFNTGKDKHIIVLSEADDIFYDDIFYEKPYLIKHAKKTNLGILTKFAKKNNIDSILEVNRGELKDLKFAIEKLYTLI